MRSSFLLLLIDSGPGGEPARGRHDDRDADDGI
jgi:hypothetical protein